MTKDVISLSISVLLLFRHYISHKITFGAPSSGGVLCSACGAFIVIDLLFFFVCFFQNQFIFQNSFRNTTRVSNSFDPGQAQHFVGPDLGPNCLLRLSADDTSSVVC